MYWRVNREWLIALAGPRAVLLELAHPAVAAGVAGHSNYRGDPFGRLYRTMKTMTELSFGSEQEARMALTHFRRCHARVHSTGAIPYDARDAQLQLWVWATLVDSVPQVYERFVSPLSPAERSAYYLDCAKLAQLLGIPCEVIPSTFSAFELYIESMLLGDELHVTEHARDIINALYAPTLRGSLTRWFSFASIGMLPSRLRDEYGYTWDRVREMRLERYASISRRLRPLLPNFLAVHPKALAMETQLTRV